MHSNIVVQAIPPAKPVFAGIGVLLAVRLSVFLFVNADILQSAMDVRDSHGALVRLFQRIQFFLKRLGFDTRISLTKNMVEMHLKILAEVLHILSIATKTMQQNPKSKLFLRDMLN
jgi:hypothetical protein